MDTLNIKNRSGAVSSTRPVPGPLASMGARPGTTGIGGGYTGSNLPMPLTMNKTGTPSGWAAQLAQGSSGSGGHHYNSSSHLQSAGNNIMSSGSGASQQRPGTTGMMNESINLSGSTQSLQQGPQYGSPHGTGTRHGKRVQRPQTQPARLNLSRKLLNNSIRNPLNMTQSKFDNSRSVFGSLDQSSAAPKRSNQAPQFLCLRVKLPTYLNTPERTEDLVDLTPEEKYSIQKKIADFELLMPACRRSNKVREEGRCAFSLGVLHDNCNEYQKGLKYYSQFLKICRDCEDKQGQALAYHCLGVSHQILGTKAFYQSNAGSGSTTLPLSTKQTQELKTALYFHNKHRKIADLVGKFIAHANLGTCYGRLLEKDASTLNHQYALRYALQLHSIEGQSLAIGNLAVSSEDLSYSGDSEKMKALIERYIELCDTLKQDQSRALKKLGKICVSQENDFEKGIQYYGRALQAANDTQTENSVLVSMGIIQGLSKMEDYFRSLTGPGNQNLGPTIGVY